MTRCIRRPRALDRTELRPVSGNRPLRPGTAGGRVRPLCDKCLNSIAVRFFLRRPCCASAKPLSPAACGSNWTREQTKCRGRGASLAISAASSGPLRGSGRLIATSKSLPSGALRLRQIRRRGLLGSRNRTCRLFQGAHELLGSRCIWPKLAPQPMQAQHLQTEALETGQPPYVLAKIAGVEMCWSYNVSTATGT